MSSPQPASEGAWSPRASPRECGTSLRLSPVRGAEESPRDPAGTCCREAVALLGKRCVSGGSREEPAFAQGGPAGPGRRGQQRWQQAGAGALRAPLELEDPVLAALRPGLKAASSRSLGVGWSSPLLSTPRQGQKRAVGAGMQQGLDKMVK